MKKAVLAGDTRISPRYEHRVTRVKNLGWLLRHAREANSVQLTRMEAGAGRMVVTADDWVFVSDFASFDVMSAWVKRPSLSHAHFTVA